MAAIRPLLSCRRVVSRFECCRTQDFMRSGVRLKLAGAFHVIHILILMHTYISYIIHLCVYIYMTLSMLGDVCFPLKLYVGSGFADCCRGLQGHLLWTFVSLSLWVKSSFALCVRPVPWVCVWTTFCPLPVPFIPNNLPAAPSCL